MLCQDNASLVAIKLSGSSHEVTARVTLHDTPQMSRRKPNATSCDATYDRCTPVTVTPMTAYIESTFRNGCRD